MTIPLLEKNNYSMVQSVNLEIFVTLNKTLQILISFKSSSQNK